MLIISVCYETPLDVAPDTQEYFDSSQESSIVLAALGRAGVAIAKDIAAGKDPFARAVGTAAPNSTTPAPKAADPVTTASPATPPPSTVIAVSASPAEKHEDNAVSVLGLCGAAGAATAAVFLLLRARSKS
jgi:hypothetical protein